MSYQAYPRPSYRQRIQIALHYLLPQFMLTRLAGWVAEQRWGGSPISSSNFLHANIA